MTEETETIFPGRRYSKYYTYIEPIIADPVIRGYFTLVASLLLTAFFILFALSPTFSTIVGLVRKIDDQKKVLAALDSKINNLILAQENYAQIESDLPLLEAALPVKPVPETILLGVLDSASGSAVAITSFQIGDVYLSGVNPTEKALVAPPSKGVKQTLVSSAGLPTVNFTVSAKGTKENIRQFVGKLESMPRLITLSVISIGKESSSNDSTNNYIADIAGNAFYKP